VRARRCKTFSRPTTAIVTRARFPPPLWWRWWECLEKGAPRRKVEESGGGQKSLVDRSHAAQLSVQCTLAVCTQTEGNQMQSTESSCASAAPLHHCLRPPLQSESASTWRQQSEANEECLAKLLPLDKDDETRPALERERRTIHLQ
jgi:hypothetical protein